MLGVEVVAVEASLVQVALLKGRRLVRLTGDLLRQPFDLIHVLDVCVIVNQKSNY